MKLGHPSPPPPLRRADLRRLERDLNVFLDVPVHPTRSMCEQYSVYDEAEVYVGEVREEVDRKFTYTTLRVAVVRLFGRCGHLFDGGPECCMLLKHTDTLPHRSTP